MPEFSVLIVFFGASLVLALAPGPDNIFVLTQSALQGWRAGLVTTFGLCTGLVVHTTAVALGISALFKTSTLAFTGLKIIGATYLLYLAWLAFKAADAKLSSNQHIELSKLYRRGILMNISNPKIAIFFLAFLPQFTDPASGTLVLQIFVLGFLFIMAAMIVFCTIALLAGSIGEWLASSSTAQSLLNKASGVIFLGLAIRLITSQR